MKILCVAPPQGERVDSGFARVAPRTAALLDSVVGDDLMLGVPFGFAFFSSLAPQSTIASVRRATPNSERRRWLLLPE